MWRDWQLYCFGPSLFQSLSHTVTDWPPFIYGLPLQCHDWFSFQSHVCVSVRMNVCKMRRENTKGIKNKETQPDRCLKMESRREMKSTAGVFSRGVPAVGSFFLAFPFLLLICSLCCSVQIYRHVHSVIFSTEAKHMQPSVSACVSDSVLFVCRYYNWQVGWSVWSWTVSQTLSSWRSRTSSRVTLRKNGCLSSCLQQTLLSDRNSNRRWTSTFCTLT